MRSSENILPRVAHQRRTQDFHDQWRIYGAGVRNSFNFMQFLGTFGKFVCWRPLEGWRPHLGEILDPQLLMEDANPYVWVKNLLLGKIFVESCMKMKENGWRVSFGSANAHNPASLVPFTTHTYQSSVEAGGGGGGGGGNDSKSVICPQ